MKRSEALAARLHAQQLGRPAADRSLTDADIFDFGIQDTGRDGASWALANRGVPVPGPAALEASPEVALAWTLRASPHYYRRDQLPDVLTATSPFSDADAAKRIVGAAKPMTEAGITVRAGLAEVAAEMRALVTGPMVKGEVSTALRARLPERHLRNCVPCGAIHPWEVPFRLGALYAGLELEPGTSPPVLRRVPGWPPRDPGPADDPTRAPPELQPIRNYVRFLGPATPADVAAFLDAPVAVVKAHWPEDAEEVEVEGRRAWWLGGDHPATDGDGVRLLGGFDLYLQGRDRDLIVPDRTRHKALWPTIGRPGAVLSGTEIVGTWRPKATGGRFAVRLEPWTAITAPVRAQIETEAERLAAHRGLTYAGLTD